jgi:DHA1 family inner membrane transport protein
MPFAVFALATGAFAISTTEFVILGLLLDVSNDFNISIASAGMLISAYAAGVVIGAPLLTPILARFPRKQVIVFLLCLFTVGNLVGALAPTYEVLLASRLVTALVHASFYGLASIVAGQLVTKDRQARAMSMVFMGATIANVLGAPAGTLIGQAWGWRTTSFACAALGVLSAVIIMFVVPKIKSEKPAGLAKEFGALLQPKVLRALALTMIGFGGTFTLLTYIAPFLTQITGYSEQYVSALLLVFGVGMAFGNPIGGWLTDKNLDLALRTTLCALFISLVVIGLFANAALVMPVLVFLFGAAMFATITPLQVNAMKAAGDAPVMAASFNIAAFNLANVLAASIGGAVIESEIGLVNLPYVAGGIAFVGLLLALASSAKRRDNVAMSAA